MRCFQNQLYFFFNCRRRRKHLWRKVNTLCWIFWWNCRKRACGKNNPTKRFNSKYDCRDFSTWYYFEYEDQNNILWIIFYISDSCKAEAIASLKQAVSARDCLRYLRDTKLFTSSDVIFVQYLFKRMDCKELFEECYRYAEEQDALCFYEKPPGNIILISQFC